MGSHHNSFIYLLLVYFFVVSAAFVVSVEAAVVEAAVVVSTVVVGAEPFFVLTFSQMISLTFINKILSLRFGEYEKDIFKYGGGGDRCGDGRWLLWGGVLGRREE